MGVVVLRFGDWHHALMLKLARVVPCGACGGFTLLATVLPPFSCEQQLDMG